jgi:hypothetical protein
MARPALSATRAVAVLNFLAGHATEEFTLSDLASRLGINLSSAHSLLAVGAVTVGILLGTRGRTLYFAFRRQPHHSPKCRISALCMVALRSGLRQLDLRSVRGFHPYLMPNHTSPAPPPSGGSSITCPPHIVRSLIMSNAWMMGGHMRSVGAIELVIGKTRHPVATRQEGGGGSRSFVSTRSNSMW